jgi:acetoin utilization deacetylase AcuC-like enzyme
VQKVLIFDCDVHQGDGTATIVANDDAIFSCSIHCEKNFPARKAVSDLDVEIEKGTTDLNYLMVVESTLVNLLASFQPDLVLYDAGVDIYEHDPLGLLNISLQGIAERDRIVISACLARSIPVATVIGGGYDRNQKAVADRHAIPVRVAADLFNG